AAEAPRVQRHQERGRGHLHRLTEWKPPRKLRKKGLDPDLADEVGIAARGVDGRREALDLVAAPAQPEHLLDDEPLATARVGEPAVEDGDPPKAAHAGAAPAADQEKA